MINNQFCKMLLINILIYHRLMKAFIFIKVKKIIIRNNNLIITDN